MAGRRRGKALSAAGPMRDGDDSVDMAAGRGQRHEISAPPIYGALLTMAERRCD